MLANNPRLQQNFIQQQQVKRPNLIDGINTLGESIGEASQKVILQPLVTRPAAEVVQTTRDAFNGGRPASYTPGSGFERALFGDAPVQSIQQKTLDQYRRQSTSSNPILRVASRPLAAAETGLSIANDAPVVAAGLKAGKVAFREASPLVARGAEVLAPKVAGAARQLPGAVANAAKAVPQIPDAIAHTQLVKSDPYYRTYSDQAGQLQQTLERNRLNGLADNNPTQIQLARQVSELNGKTAEMRQAMIKNATDNLLMRGDSEKMQGGYVQLPGGKQVDESFYHGTATGNKFNKFDPKYNSGVGGNALDQGDVTYLTNNKHAAEYFSTKANKNKMLREGDVQKMMSYKDEVGTVHKVQLAKDAKVHVLDHRPTPEEVQALKAQGIDAVKFPDTAFNNLDENPLGLVDKATREGAPQTVAVLNADKAHIQAPGAASTQQQLAQLDKKIAAFGNDHSGGYNRLVAERDALTGNKPNPELADARKRMEFYTKPIDTTLYRGSNDHNVTTAHPDRPVFHAETKDYAETYGKAASSQAKGRVLDINSANAYDRNEVARLLPTAIGHDRFKALSRDEQDAVRPYLRNSLDGPELSRVLTKPMPEVVKDAYHQLGIDYIRIDGSQFPGTVGKVGHQTEIIQLPKPKGVEAPKKSLTEKLGIKPLGESGHASGDSPLMPANKAIAAAVDKVSGKLASKQAERLAQSKNIDPSKESIAPKTAVATPAKSAPVLPGAAKPTPQPAAKEMSAVSQAKPKTGVADKQLSEIEKARKDVINYAAEEIRDASKPIAGGIREQIGKHGIYVGKDGLPEDYRDLPVHLRSTDPNKPTLDTVATNLGYESEDDLIKAIQENAPGKGMTKAEALAEAESQLEGGKHPYSEDYKQIKDALTKRQDELALYPNGKYRQVKITAKPKTQRMSDAELQSLQNTPEGIRQKAFTTPLKPTKTEPKTAKPPIIEDPVVAKEINSKPAKAEFMDATNRHLGSIEAAKTANISTVTELPKMQQSKSLELMDALEKGVMSGDFKTAPAEVRSILDAKHKELTDAGVDIGYLENYFPHKWQDEDAVKQAYRTLNLKAGIQNPREIPTISEGVGLGFKPVTTDYREAVNNYLNTADRLLANRKYFSELKDQGLIAEAGSRPQGMQIIDAPGLPQPKLFSDYESGNQIQGSYYAKPDVARELNKLFGEQSRNKFFKATGNVSKNMQQLFLSGGLPGTPLNAFGVAQLQKQLLAGHPINGFKEFGRAFSEGATSKYEKANLDHIQRMQKAGLPYSGTLDDKSLTTFGEKIANSEGMKGRTATLFKEGWSKLVEDPTFRRMLPLYQLDTFKGVYLKQLKNGKTEAQATRIAARATQHAFGLNTLAKDALRSKTQSDVVSTFFFAPRFRESMINFWKDNVKALGKPTSPEYRENLKFLAGATGLFGAMQAANYAINGHSTFGNENPNDRLNLSIPRGDGKSLALPYLSSIATVPRTAINAGIDVGTGRFKDAGMEGKKFLSQEVRPLVDLATNQKYNGRQIINSKDTTGQRLKDGGVYLAGQYNHPYIQAGLNAATGKSSGPLETAATAAELPVRFRNYDASQPFAGNSGKSDGKIAFNTSDAKKFLALSDADKKAAAATDANARGLYDQYQALKTGTKPNTLRPTGLDEQSTKTLNKFDHLTTGGKAKLLSRDNGAEYQLKAAQYASDKAANKLTQAEDIKRRGELAKAKVGANFAKDTRDLYGLSKSEVYDLITQDPNGNKLAEDLLAYGDALQAAGITDNKFRTKRGAVAFNPKKSGSGTTTSDMKKLLAAFKTPYSDLVKTSAQGASLARSAGLAKRTAKA